VAAPLAELINFGRVHWRAIPRIGLAAGRQLGAQAGKLARHRNRLAVRLQFEVRRFLSGIRRARRDDPVSIGSSPRGFDSHRRVNSAILATFSL
jgi:hypothetical protein